MEDLEKRMLKLQAVIITMATVIIGLTSYIYYLSSTDGEQTNQRCEYNGWAYANGETYSSSDECNTCVCTNGETVCTEMACLEDPFVPPTTCDVEEIEGGACL